MTTRRRAEQSTRRWAAIALLATGSVSGCSPAQPAAAPPATRPLSPSEHSALEIATMAKCLEAQGWKVKVAAEGGIDAQMPVEQLDAYEKASGACREQFLAAHPRPALDRAALVKLYKHQLLLVDCLKDKGYPPVMEIPSQEAFVAAGLEGASHDFYAWSAVGNIGGSAAAELERDCPQAPPGM